MKINKKILITGSVVLLVLIAVIYLGVSVFYEYHFLPGTTINGVDYSNKSVDDVKADIQNNIRTYYLKIIERNGEVEHIAAGDIGLTVTIDGDLDKIKKGQNHYMWFAAPKDNATLEVTVAYDEPKLDYAIQNLKCLNDDYISSGVAPVLGYDGVQFTLVGGEIGNELDKELTKTYIKEAISNMSTVLNLENKGVYLENIDESADAKLKAALDELNSYLDVEITLTFGESKEIINKNQIYKWVSVDINNEIVFDEQAIINYVDSFADKYETLGQTRQFTTSYGDTIRLSGGDYGWWINRKGEAAAIINDIQNLNSCTREATYLQKAHQHGDVDFGDTYIEINLYDQHLYAYKDGEKVVDCYIVSGDPVNGKATPTGLFNLRFTFKNYTFVRGEFTKKLAYWMCFYGNSVDTNIGLASCDWLTEFGGNVYKGAGSLGSIYIDPANAKLIYQKLPSKDIPIIIYNDKH
ncbi:MAG: peptidoglycan binding domain-containing protein [Lachnospiraceae bacterium]|nr:peptidoglycan binding domain-containing protein [Lachnospiraceae bacterium]